MDIVFIRGLRADTVIGVYDWERNVRQSVLLDLEMATDIPSIMRRSLRALCLLLSTANFN